MRRCVCLCLILAILMTACSFAMGEGDAPSLPAVGDAVCGFTVKEVRSFELVGADAVMLEHDKTGARVFYIANDDINRVFELVFATEPIDDTGLPHVFEHSTLSGSEKYPSKSLFFNLAYQTYNSYMNAATYDRMTAYPVASLSEEQLLKYADFYTDSCLHPMILQDESIFRTEAWRYRLDSADADLTLEGTVYSEMLGAADQSEQAYYNALKNIFPGSHVGYNFGGNPDAIPEMTWDALKAYHEAYYHPSNCTAYLYGEFKDYTAFLKLLDDAFAGYEKREFTHVDSGYTPLETSPEPVKLPFAVEKGVNTNKASTLYYGIICRGLPASESTALTVLIDCITASSSELMQTLSQSYPASDLSAYLEEAGPEPVVLFSIENVNEEDVDSIIALIDQSFRDVAENGIAQSLIDSTTSGIELDVRMIRENGDTGVNIISAMAYNAAVTGNPWSYSEYIDELEHVSEWNEQGVYNRLATDYLVNESAIRVVTLTYPEPGLKEQKDAELAARLAEIKASLTDEEIEKIVSSTQAQSESDDSSQYVRALTAVTVASLPEEVSEYEVTDNLSSDGVRHVNAVAGVEGIGNANIFLDANGLTQDQIHYFELYVDLLGALDTELHSRAEIAALSERYLYRGEIRMSLLGDASDADPHLRATWFAADEDLDEGYDLLYELLFETKFDDVEQLSNGILDVTSQLHNSLSSTPYTLALYRMAGRDNAAIRYLTYCRHLDYYEFLLDVYDQMSSDPQTVCSNLKAIQSYFNNRENGISLFAGNEESIAVNDALVDAFFAQLNAQPIEKQAYDLPAAAAREGIIMDTAVSYNAMAIGLNALGLDEYTGDLDAVTTLVNDMFLMPQLRDQYGVYSVLHGVDPDLGMYVLTYRDPNVTQSYDVFAQLPDLVSSLDIDQETLEGYILSSYSILAMPEGELSGAVSAAVDVLAPETADDTLNYMRQLKSITTENLADYANLYVRLIERGNLVTVGSASTINANADLFDEILNPFGVKDTSEVVFDDLPEDHPQYEAGRFLFDYGYLEPVSDTEFGIDEPVSMNELLGVMYYEFGGENDPDTAYDLFSQMGLIGATVDREGVATELDAIGLINGVLAMSGETWSFEADETPLTRGRLGEILIQFEDEFAE